MHLKKLLLIASAISSLASAERPKPQYKYINEHVQEDESLTDPQCGRFQRFKHTFTDNDYENSTSADLKAKFLASFRDLPLNQSDYEGPTAKYTDVRMVAAPGHPTHSAPVFEVKEDPLMCRFAQGDPDTNGEYAKWANDPKLVITTFQAGGKCWLDYLSCEDRKNLFETGGKSLETQFFATDQRLYLKSKRWQEMSGWKRLKEFIFGEFGVDLLPA